MTSNADTEKMAATDTSPSKQSLRLWLRLLACENIIENRIRTALKDQFGITLPQFDVLAELEFVGKPLTMTQLSQRLLVSNGNVTGVIDRLVREGYVRRVPSSEDRRVYFIELTTTGGDAFRVMAEQHEIWIAAMFRDLPEAERTTLLSLLSKTHESLKSGPDDIQSK